MTVHQICCSFLEENNVILSVIRLVRIFWFMKWSYLRFDVFVICVGFTSCKQGPFFLVVIKLEVVHLVFVEGNECIALLYSYIFYTLLF